MNQQGPKGAGQCRGRMEGKCQLKVFSRIGQFPNPVVDDPQVGQDEWILRVTLLGFVKIDVGLLIVSPVNIELAHEGSEPSRPMIPRNDPRSVAIGGADFSQSEVDPCEIQKDAGIVRTLDKGLLKKCLRLPFFPDSSQSNRQVVHNRHIVGRAGKRFLVQAHGLRRVSEEEGLMGLCGEDTGRGWSGGTGTGGHKESRQETRTRNPCQIQDFHQTPLPATMFSFMTPSRGLIIMPPVTAPRNNQPWEPLAQGAYRLRILLLAIPFVLAMVENARHPFPLWSFFHELWGHGAPILPLERRLLMLPPLCLYAGGLFLRLSASSILGTRSVWSRTPEARELHVEGLYGIVRHPIYLGSAGMILALSLVSSPQGALLLLGIDIPLLFWFSLIEEREIMALHPEYGGYRQRVPGLLPRLPIPPGTLMVLWKALCQNHGQALRSEALNVALLGGFIAFWATPNLHFFWGGAIFGLLGAFSAPVWWRSSGGKDP